MPSLQLLRKLALKLNADEQYLATGVEQVQQPPPELIEAEVERRLAGGRPDPTTTDERPAGGLEDPAHGPACSGSTRAAGRHAASAAARRPTPATRSRCSTTRTT